MSEFEDEYSESLEDEFRTLEGALLDDTVRLLAPAEPIRMTADETVAGAVGRMVSGHRAAVVVVDAQGRLEGILRLLIRVLGQGRDPGQTRLGDVMTRDPESLAMSDRIGYALNRMYLAGYRTIPIVDDAGRQVGITTVQDVVKWLAEISRRRC